MANGLAIGGACVGSVSASICEELEVLPLHREVEGDSVSLMKRTMNREDEEMLGFTLGTKVKLTQLPNHPEVVQAFEVVIALCRKYRSTLDQCFSQSAEEALDAITKGEQPQCCQPIIITDEQDELMMQITEAHEHFLQTLDTYCSQDV